MTEHLEQTDPTSWTQADVKRAFKRREHDKIDAARRAGKLDHLMSGQVA